MIFNQVIKGGGGSTPPATPTDALLFYSEKPFNIYISHPFITSGGILYYSTDSENYTEWNISDHIYADLYDDYYVLYIRGSSITAFAIDYNQYTTINVNGTAVKCVGNVNTLLDYQNPPMTLSSYAFVGLFTSNGTVDFDVELPATIIGQYCYHRMFVGCTSLFKAPALPATIMANRCYAEMFKGCTALMIPPVLPATVLDVFCYYGMFYGCQSLTSAPELPATTLTQGCYGQMFYETGIIESPALPATTLAVRCYESLYGSCFNIISLPELPATMLAEGCYRYMFSGCPKIKISSSQTGDYQSEYRIPSNESGTDATSALTNMFTSTGGTFVGTPTINTTYYTSNTVIPAI